MATPPATISTKSLIVILSLAAVPAVSFAQATGGANRGSAGGVANSSAPAPGTNSLGTALSSGATNTAPGVTTGAATSPDAAVSAENKLLDRKLKSICRGC